MVGLLDKLKATVSKDHSTKQANGDAQARLNTEHHPEERLSRSQIPTGRGGAGNFRSSESRGRSPNQAPTTPDEEEKRIAALRSASRSRSHVSGGRGGVGNYVQPNQEPSATQIELARVEEEKVREKYEKEHAAEGRFVGGRGGAGNRE